MPDILSGGENPPNTPIMVSPKLS